MSRIAEVFLCADCVAGAVPDEAQFIRRLDGPGARQFDVLELGGMVLVHDTEGGEFVARIGLSELLDKMAVAVLKHNSGERCNIIINQGASIDI